MPRWAGAEREQNRNGGHGQQACTIKAHCPTTPCTPFTAGPVTILQWSFPRADVSRREQAEQLALALRQEVADLEAAGCRVLQVGWLLEELL